MRRDRRQTLQKQNDGRDNSEAAYEMLEGYTRPVMDSVDDGAFIVDNYDVARPSGGVARSGLLHAAGCQSASRRGGTATPRQVR